MNAPAAKEWPAPRGVPAIITLVSAALYLAWIFVAAVAHWAGLAALPPGAGPLLSGGILLGVALFAAVAHVSPVDAPPTPAIVGGHSVMALLWTALYSHFTGLTLSPLTSGMYLTAIAFAAPWVCLQWLRRLMAGALGASLAVGLHAGWGVGSGLLAAILTSAVMLPVFALLYTATAWHARQKARLAGLNERLRLDMDRMARRAERAQATQTWGRRQIVEVIAQEKVRADRTNDPFCVCLVDIDHFDAMAERIGAAAGTRLLAGFTRRVRGALRAMDSLGYTGRQLEPGRQSGDQFIVLLPHTGLAGALHSAERIRRAVLRRSFDGLHQVTVSAGIAEYRPGETVATLLGRARQALSSARRTGRNRVNCATPDGRDSAVIMPDLFSPAARLAPRHTAGADRRGP